MAGAEGLVFNEDKTRIVHLEEGFDFLGFNLRRYRRGDRPGKLLIKPSQDAVRRIRRRLADEIRGTRGSNGMTGLQPASSLVMRDLVLHVRSFFAGI